MLLAKRTYNLPADKLQEFEAQVSPGKRSALIGQLIESWLEDKRREELRAAVLKGLEDSYELDEEVEREWSHLSDELWSSLPEEEWPEPKESW